MGRDEIVAALEDEGYVVVEWTDPPGTDYPEHVHHRDEVRVVLEGSLTLRTPSEERTLLAGDRFEIRAGEPHAARAGAQGARYLAAHRG